MRAHRVAHAPSCRAGQRWWRSAAWLVAVQARFLASGGEGGLGERCSCWWAGVLMSTDYELSEPLERLQSSDGYGTVNRVHTFGVAQNQK